MSYYQFVSKRYKNSRNIFSLHWNLTIYYFLFLLPFFVVRNDYTPNPLIDAAVKRLRPSLKGE